MNPKQKHNPGNGRAVSMPSLQKAIDANSYDFLNWYAPDLLSALEVEVGKGITPEQIKRYIVAVTGRVEIALRCEQAARHLLSIVV